MRYVPTGRRHEVALDKEENVKPTREQALEWAKEAGMLQVYYRESAADLAGRLD